MDNSHSQLHTTGTEPHRDMLRLGSIPSIHKYLWSVTMVGGGLGSWYNG